MNIFWKQPDEQSKYSEENLRNDVAAALQRARNARIHSVICQRVIHSVADAEAQRRATTDAVMWYGNGREIIWHGQVLRPCQGVWIHRRWSGRARPIRACERSSSRPKLVTLDRGERIAYQAVKNNRGFKAMNLERIAAWANGSASR
jgi:hypothetical protein